MALANLNGSTFESTDGNLVAASGKDWSNAPSLVTGADLDSGKGDNSLGQGAKEDLSDTTVVTGSIPPNKSDLTRFYVANEKVGSNHFLYLSWQRTNTLGSANMDFEINKNAQPTMTTAGAKTLNRSLGDLLVRYDFSNGGTVPTLSLVKWITAPTGSAGDCYKNQSLPCWGALPADDNIDGTNDQQIQLSSQGIADGSINASTVTDPYTDASLPEATFGEAAINLTAAGVFPAGQCVNFGSVYLKSRSSSAFDAELKDFVAPQAVSINNCGNLVIRKITIGGTGTFGFNSPNAAITDQTADPTTKFELTTTAANTPASTGTLYHGLLAGTYNISENTPPAGWEETSATCDNGDSPSAVEITPESTVTCTFTNTAKATLRIDKVTNPSGDATQFTFVPSASLPVGNFQLADATQAKVYDDLAVGTYGVAENDPTPAFDLTGLACVRTGTSTAVGTTSLATRSFSVTLAAGDDVTCTFTNTKRGRVDIVKTDDDSPAARLPNVTFTLYNNVAPLDAPRTGIDTITNPLLSCTTVSSADPAINGTCEIENIPLGEYWLVESGTPTGHASAPDQRLTVTAGSTVQKTFVNPRQFKVITLVCRNSDNSLYSSSVKFDGETKSSLSTAPAFATAAELCSLGGASFSPKAYDNYTGGEVNIPQ